MERKPGYGQMTAIETGEWAGWSEWRAKDPFEALTGPYYCRYEEDGRPRTALVAEQRHMNGGRVMHGGALMTFVDYTLFFIMRNALGDDPAVTATCNCEFVGGVLLGDRVEGTGEIVKAGGSMLFGRGLLTVRGEPVLSFSGVLKRFKIRT
jgi:acyl-coenzyme A thioesterase PaaI-like protein